MSNQNVKTVLFHGFNTPGHNNFLLALADELKEKNGFRTVFVLLGPSVNNTIRNHGHELISLDENSFIEDYEIEHEGDEILNQNGYDGKRKVKLTGYPKYENYGRKIMENAPMDFIEASARTLNIFRRLVIEPEITKNHDNLASVINSINPDLIVLDVYMVPPSVLLRTDIPWVKCFSPCPLIIAKASQALGVKPLARAGFELMDKERRAKMRQERPEEWAAMIESWKAANEKFDELTGVYDATALNKFYRQKGFPEPPTWGHLSPYLNLYLYPKEIDYDQDDDILEYESRWFRCDSFIRKPDFSDSDGLKFWADKLDEAMKGKKELVYFSLGSLASGGPKLIQKYIDILSKDQDRLYVVSKGRNGDQFELNPTNMIGGNYIPQTFFLERADLAIVHGGNNSLFECMYFGLPMIVLPVFGDQPDNAQRVEDCGFGKRLDVYKCNEEELIGAINEILANRKLIEKARLIGEQMRERNAKHSNISKLIRKLIDEKSLDEEFIELCRRD